MYGYLMIFFSSYWNNIWQKIYVDEKGKFWPIDILVFSIQMNEHKSIPSRMFLTLICIHRQSEEIFWI